MLNCPLRLFPCVIPFAYWLFRPKHARDVLPALKVAVERFALVSEDVLFLRRSLDVCIAAWAE
ncbi:hypothetical protein D3C79_1064770 [compost metagenome]